MKKKFALSFVALASVALLEKSNQEPQTLLVTQSMKRQLKSDLTLKKQVP